MKDAEGKISEGNSCKQIADKGTVYHNPIDSNTQKVEPLLLLILRYNSIGIVPDPTLVSLFSGK